MLTITFQLSSQYSKRPFPQSQRNINASRQSRTTITMNNTHIIFLNNSAVDALHAGDIAKGFKILSQTFFHSIRNSHATHNLKPTAREGTSLEFSLQDCSRNLERAMHKPLSEDDSCKSFLCLNFLRMEIPTDKVLQQGVDEMCNCAVAWALGYNLSVVYALMGFQRGSKRGGGMYFKKSLRMLGPIKRQVLLQKSQSPFWTNLKLCILNNHICIHSEIRNPCEVSTSVLVMDGLLVQSRRQLDPMDVKKYYLSMQFLNMCESIAAAA